MGNRARPDSAPNAQLVCALDGLSVGIVMMDANGRINWINRVAQRVLGLDPRADLGESLARQLRDPQLTNFWHQACHADGTVMGKVSIHEPTRAELNLNATQSLDESGDVVARALIFCDVTKERTVQVSLSEEATRRLLDAADRWNDNGASHEALTPAEMRMLRCVGAGLSNGQIAKTHHISPATVRSHLKHVYRKIAVGSRSEAISYAVRHGLICDAVPGAARGRPPG